MATAPPSLPAHPTDPTLVLAIEQSRAAKSPPVRSLSRRPCAFSTSLSLEVVDVSFETGEPVQFILKHHGRDRLIPEARNVRPSFLQNPAREIAVYQHLLSAGPAGPPRLVAASVDATSNTAWMLVESVPGDLLCHTGDLAAWTQAADWLAHFHLALTPLGQISHRDAVPAVGVPLLRYDESFYRTWVERARTSFRSSADLRSSKPLAAAIDRYEASIPHLLRLPTTVIHGEFYSSNIIVRAPSDDSRSAAGALTGGCSASAEHVDPGKALAIAQSSAGEGTGGTVPRKPTICPIDWEMASIGPPWMDLAALTAGNWADTDRKAMEQAYFKANPIDQRTLSPQDESTALSLCRLHIAMQWIGWSEGWLAPKEHATDWAGLAISAAGELRE